mmetsp:Transcript_9178/g.19068  ORF Transcript_9178/g.19068 Transcript_9178/m.19068 type:complete len:253 (+) Transcript_9178:320-1078(+)
MSRYMAARGLRYCGKDFAWFHHVEVGHQNIPVGFLEWYLSTPVRTLRHGDLDFVDFSHLDLQDLVRHVQNLPEGFVGGCLGPSCLPTAPAVGSHKEGFDHSVKKRDPHGCVQIIPFEHGECQRCCNAHVLVTAFHRNGHSFRLSQIYQGGQTRSDDQSEQTRRSRCDVKGPVTGPYPRIGVPNVGDGSTKDNEQKARNVSHFVGEHVEFVGMGLVRHIEAQANGRNNNRERHKDRYPVQILCHVGVVRKVGV